MKRYYSIAIFFVFSLWAFSFPDRDGKAESEGAVSKINHCEFKAGSDIVLEFSVKSEHPPQLFVRNSYGSTLLNAVATGDLMAYRLPPVFSKKSGKLNWILVSKGKQLLSGVIDILPDSTAGTRLENYFGPRQIQAGDRDFSMLVSVPTDAFDNPLPENTAVVVHQQFSGEMSSSEVSTSHLIAWQNIYARQKAGNVLVSTSCNNQHSKELTTKIYPSNAVAFKISSSRGHEFADGNQQVRFSTSTIKDAFGNVISDGTQVEFVVKNKAGNLLKTYGETVNGVAKAVMLHPEFPDQWSVNAYITGLAGSNELKLSYKAVLNDFPVAFANGNREITVGPLFSFMNQLIPDGVNVKLHMMVDGKLHETKTEYSKGGMAVFLLEPEFYPGGDYRLAIDALGVTKEFDKVKLNERVK